MFIFNSYFETHLTALHDHLIPESIGEWIAEQITVINMMSLVRAVEELAQDLILPSMVRKNNKTEMFNVEYVTALCLWSLSHIIK